MRAVIITATLIGLATSAQAQSNFDQQVRTFYACRNGNQDACDQLRVYTQQNKREADLYENYSGFLGSKNAVDETYGSISRQRQEQNWGKTAHEEIQAGDEDRRHAYQAQQAGDWNAARLYEQRAQQHYDTADSYQKR